jgi:hypothetical protein
MEMTMTIRFEASSSKKNPARVWVKQVESVDPGGRGGLAFAGPWAGERGALTQELSGEGVFLICCDRDRGKKAFWLVRGGVGELSDPPQNGWFGHLSGDGVLLYAGQSHEELMAACLAAGVPAAEGSAPAPRAPHHFRHPERDAMGELEAAEFRLQGWHPVGDH